MAQGHKICSSKFKDMSKIELLPIVIGECGARSAGTSLDPVSPNLGLVGIEPAERSTAVAHYRWALVCSLTKSDMQRLPQTGECHPGSKCGRRSYHELGAEGALHNAEGGSKQLAEHALILEEVKAEQVLRGRCVHEQLVQAAEQHLRNVKMVQTTSDHR